MINQWDIVIKYVAFNEKFIWLCPVFYVKQYFLLYFKYFDAFKFMSYFKSLRTLEYLNVLTVVSHPVESLIAKIIYSCSFRPVIYDKVLSH